MQSVLGEKVWQWFLPILTVQGDGYEYCHNNSLLRHAGYANDDEDSDDNDSY